MNTPPLPPVTDKEYSHDHLGDAFYEALSEYDTERRLDTLIDEFLTDEMIKDKNVLDVGCGLGFFSERLVQRGATVTACDIGPNLIEKTRARAKCHAEVVDALSLERHFGRDHFDIVVSSECIEHTRSPKDAIAQMAAVLKPGGFLSVSTPNLLWYPVVRLATILKARPFDGFEKFSSWPTMRRTLAANDIAVVRERGLHLVPFQLPCHGLSKWCDQHMQIARYAMINICVLGRKLRPGTSQS